MPKKLLFQVSKKSSTLTNQFTCTILEKIYPQRFLLKNQVEVEQKRAKVDILREKLKIL